jgi:outer membrane protein OmpA-like peptidoglycan-associated protein
VTERERHAQQVPRQPAGEAEREAPPAGRAEVVLAFQRSAGNAAVTRALQRFTGPEHRDLGDVAGRDIDLGDGVVLTWGQVVAIAGDEYETYQELQAAVATRDGRERLRAKLEHDGVPGAIAAKLPAPTQTQREEEKRNYVLLAMRNQGHFPEDAMDLWREHHAQALNAAMLAGLTGNPQGMQRAQLIEAFGEHFLTDSFSGGHIRTPRREIGEWYSGTWGPRHAGAAFFYLRERLIDGIAQQVAGLAAPVARGRVAAAVEPQVDAAVAKLGGVAGFGRLLGTVIGGAVSGALHDAEGARGVMVTSQDHPQTWRAMGDGRLDARSDSFRQAQQAILAARGDLDAAFQIGQQEAGVRDIVPAAPASVVHFPFDSSELSPADAHQVQAAAAYLLYDETGFVDVVGHTDPVGGDTYNEALGRRRAEAVAEVLTGGGVAPDRFALASHGERRLLTKDPHAYARNRRVELTWTSRPAGNGAHADGAETAADRAWDAVVAAIGPPFKHIERFVPHALPTAQGNPELPDWHWGNLPAQLQGQIDDWARNLAGKDLRDALARIAELDPQEVEGHKIRPRDVAEAILNDLLAAPTRVIGEMVGQPPG